MVAASANAAGVASNALGHPTVEHARSQSCHVELQTPEGIRVHQPGIFAEDVGRKQVEMSGNIPNKEAPPCHNHTIAHYEKLKKEHPDLADNTLAFRAWLSLDRRLVGAILFLAVFNLIVSASTVVVFLFMQINMSNFVTVQALAAAAVFAYLYAPTEHGLSRGVFTLPCGAHPCGLPSSAWLSRSIYLF